MPYKPMKPCKHSGCRYLTHDKYCKEHEQLYDRPTPTERGYDRRWNIARKRYLAENPICVECAKNGRPVEAIVVDHRQPHNGDPVLFWDQQNWQALCVRCHSRKTSTTDGGFGRGKAYGY